MSQSPIEPSAPAAARSSLSLVGRPWLGRRHGPGRRSQRRRGLCRHRGLNKLYADRRCRQHGGRRGGTAALRGWRPRGRGGNRGRRRQRGCLGIERRTGLNPFLLGQSAGLFAGERVRRTGRCGPRPSRPGSGRRRREGHRGHFGAVPLQGVQQLSGDGVPDLDGLVPTACRQRLELSGAKATDDASRVWACFRWNHFRRWPRPKS